LPSREIIVIFRSDGSGTTYVWTDYLSKTVPAWRDQVGIGTTVEWPVGFGARGNKGVIDVIQETPYTIAYAELTFAILANLPYGSVENASAKFVKADLKSVVAAAEATINSMPGDYRLSITNAPGEDSYPIASYTWLLIPSHFADPAKKELLQKFLRWALTQGQTVAPSVNYVPLPAQLAAEERLAIDQIK
jgi:phosphate transport system substrate-binding protein